jgi:Na+/melibiose symporter-like transporter
VVQGSVGWSERGVATASTLFTRKIGQTIGAGLAGAILNFGISRRAPNIIDALDLLLEASRREGRDAQHIARMVEAVASSLHVHANVPAKLYWSVTVYAGATHALIRNTHRSSRASNTPGLEKNALQRAQA